MFAAPSGEGSPPRNRHTVALRGQTGINLPVWARGRVLSSDSHQLMLMLIPKGRIFNVFQDGFEKVIIYIDDFFPSMHSWTTSFHQTGWRPGIECWQLERWQRGSGVSSPILHLLRGRTVLKLQISLWRDALRDPQVGGTRNGSQAVQRRRCDPARCWNVAEGNGALGRDENKTSWAVSHQAPSCLTFCWGKKRMPPVPARTTSRLGAQRWPGKTTEVLTEGPIWSSTQQVPGRLFSWSHLSPGRIALRGPMRGTGSDLLSWWRSSSKMGGSGSGPSVGAITCRASLKGHQRGFQGANWCVGPSLTQQITKNSHSSIIHSTTRATCRVRQVTCSWIWHEDSTNKCVCKEQHLHNYDGGTFWAGLCIRAALKYARAVLDQLDHDFVTDVLILYGVTPWRYTGRERATQIRLLLI